MDQIIPNHRNIDSFVVSYDHDTVKAAILARRDESRRLNDDWSHGDKDTWESLPADKS